MGYEDIDLAKIRVNEALKMGLESQRVHREMNAGRSGSRETIKAFLYTKILAVRCFLLDYGNKFYCRTLEFFHARPACA